MSILLKGLSPRPRTKNQRRALVTGDTGLGVFSILAKILPLLKFNKENIKTELEEGYACATELADLLAKKGVPFRKAHEITGQVVKDCIAKKKWLSALSAAEVSALWNIYRYIFGL